MDSSPIVRHDIFPLAFDAAVFAFQMNWYKVSRKTSSFSARTFFSHADWLVVIQCKELSILRGRYFPRSPVKNFRARARFSKIVFLLVIFGCYWKDKSTLFSMVLMPKLYLNQGKILKKIVNFFKTQPRSDSYCNQTVGREPLKTNWEIKKIWHLMKVKLTAVR